MTDELEKIIKQLKTLKQYKDLPDEELEKVAQTKLTEKELDEDLDIEDMFIDKTEKKEAKILIKKYLDTYSLASPSDRNTVKQLVFLEVFNNRLQRELNEYYKEGQPTPVKTVESLHSNLNKITELKDKLGLSKDKKEKSQNDSYAVMDTLFKKWKIWREENQGGRTGICPHCGKMFRLKIRMDAWEMQKHPFFKDRVLANKPLMMIYKEGRITKQDVASILGVSLDYVDWMISKIYFREFNIPKPKEVIDELESGTIEEPTT
jgi:hypothetical protein